MGTKEKPQYVMAIGAHNDDQIVGAGGTLIKYAREGKNIITIIFSYGESSHPWLERKEIVKTRVSESKRAEKITGEEKVIYFGLKEGEFREQAKEKHIFLKLAKLIKDYDPEKIFTHSMDDPHPDHRAVFDITTTVTDKMKYTGDVYSFDVWNPINIRERNAPKLVVDISKTFPAKIKAFKLHKSQQVSYWSLFWNVYLKSYWNGLKNNHKYAEVFFKVR